MQKTSPNQRVIRIRKTGTEAGQPYGIVYADALTNAVKRLSPCYAALALWEFLALQQDGYQIMSGVNGQLRALGLSPASYQRGISKLRDEGFLVPDPARKSTEIFEVYPEDHRAENSKLSNSKFQNTQNDSFKTIKTSEENSITNNTKNIITSVTSVHSARMNDARDQKNECGPEAKNIVDFMDRIHFDHSTIDNVGRYVGAALRDGVTRQHLLEILTRARAADSPTSYFMSAVETARRTGS